MLEIVTPLGPSMIYLHSQTSAMGFYERCGFIPFGETFMEADIEHIKMYYPIPE
jgi:predicted GNAT family N-acyltransferase